MASKKSSGLVVAALVIGLLPFGAASAQAADLGVLSIDCDIADIVGATIVATGGVGDTFVIDNTGTTDNCVITATALLTGEDADHDSAGAGVVTPGGGNSGAITVVGSGTFTVSSDGTGTPARSFVIDACSLEGSGVAATPWQVGDKDDLTLVGYSELTDVDASGYIDSCSLSGHYLQTANITEVDTDVSGSRVTGSFTGTYDGNHYNIGYYSGGRNGTYEGRDPLFEELGPNGIIRKLSLNGNIKSSGTTTASLVENLYGGTISEVKSSVVIQVDDDSDAILGGLAARSGGVDQDALIIYSKFNGSLEWIETNPGTTQEGPTIGGLIGIASGTGVSEIRDSYSRAAISFDSRGLVSDPTGTPFTDDDSAVYAGGLVGSDGQNELSGDGVALPGGDGDRVHLASELRIVRSYFAGSFTNTCVGTAAFCNIDSPSHVFTGGLIGVSEDLDDTRDILVSAFWLSSSATNAVGEIVDAGTQPLDYTAATPALPEAPGLTATLLKTLSTYQSEEGITSGSPSGDSDLSVASSTGTLAEQDYRWAIEQGNIQTFVASDYTSEANFLTRQLFSDTDISQSYLREGAGDLTAHGGTDAATVTGYPTLGRLWEICANSNSGYPFLVWEELDCSAPGSGGSSSSSTSELASAAGLTEAEYAEFLASGLTLEQFKAARLAATGPDGALLVGGGSLTLLFLAAGAIILVALGRERRLRRS